MPFMKSLPWIFPVGTTQFTMISTPDTSELPKTPQWDWNYLLHNFRHVNKQTDSSATSLHPSNL